MLEAGAAGTFEFQAGFTDVLTHTIQLFPGDPVDNELTDWYLYVIPRTKASYSASWSIGPVTATIHGQRLGGLPNYDGTQRLGAYPYYSRSWFSPVGREFFAEFNYHFGGKGG